MSQTGRNTCHILINSPCLKAWQRFLWANVLFSLLAISATSQDSVFDKRITIPNQQTTVYQALNQISDSIGYFFIYNSKVVNSDKQIRLSVRNEPLGSVLNKILSDTTLSYKAIGKHILIHRDTTQELASSNVIKDDPKSYLNIRGQVFDAQTKLPIPFATVGIAELNIGNVTNYDGLFLLKIPQSQSNGVLTISHIGYKSKRLPIELLGNDKVDLFLEIDHISIQEVIIRNVDPLGIVREAIQKVPDNYQHSPAYLTAFYREGVKKNSKYINYSEGVFQVYKSAYSGRVESDQLKLLKSRKIQNIDMSDTLIIKLKGGLGSSLILDIIKNPPTFLDPFFFDYYNYYRSDITTINDRSAYAIEFVQKENVADPLLKGVLYIDMENLAILSASFQINPEYVSKAGDLLVVKGTRKYSIKPQQVSYTVSYQHINGQYYLSHVRGDLHFKYRKRRQLLSNNFYVFIEMATSSIDTINVTRFDRKEIERPTNVFLEGTFDYDDAFWADLNHITPEENLQNSLSKINSKIEQILPK